MDDVKKDARFSHISKDPRFRHMKLKERKIKIDKRFQGMFNDKRFKLKYTVDKRGRPMRTTTDENLQRFYELSDSEESDSDEDSDEEEIPVKKIESDASKTKKSGAKMAKDEKQKKVKSKLKEEDNLKTDIGSVKNQEGSTPLDGKKKKKTKNASVEEKSKLGGHISIGKKNDSGSVDSKKKKKVKSKLAEDEDDKFGSVIVKEGMDQGTKKEKQNKAQQLNSNAETKVKKQAKDTENVHKQQKGKKVQKKINSETVLDPRFKISSAKAAMWEGNSDDDSDDSEDKETKKARPSKINKKVQKPQKNNSNKDDSNSDDGDDYDDDDDEVSGSSKDDGKIPGEEEEDSEDEELEEEDGDSEEDDMKVDRARGEGLVETSEEDEDEESDEDDDFDKARGEGLVETSSEDEEEEDEEEEEEEEDEEIEMIEPTEVEHDWGELDKEAPRVDEISCRLAVCNMDWDRIKAQDLLILLTSFKPATGIIHSVTIYPSEFGLERMKEEELQGPRELTEKPANVTEDMDEEEAYHQEKLRQYQLNRLKYYYAVVECDTKETANHIYEECDGLEYESSSAVMDLRFIPDDMTFDQAPRDVAKEMPDSAVYKPSKFFTSALQHTKVELTWDETDKERIAVTTKNYKKEDLEDLDVRAYLASDSEGEGDPYAGFEDPDFGQQEELDEEDEEKQIEKYRALLRGVEDKEKEKEAKDTEMEISWEPGLKETTEGLIKDKQDQEDLTPWEQYLEKKKEKKRKKREDKQKDKDPTVVTQPQEQEETISDDELPDGIDLNDPYFKEELEAQGRLEEVKLKGQGQTKKQKKGKKGRKGKHEEDQGEKDALSLMIMDEADDKQHFSLDAIMKSEKKGKKKRKRKAEESKAVSDNFKIDVSDPRFNALYNTAAYNIDPSAPEFKKTQAMEALIQEKLKRRMEEGNKPKTAKKPKKENTNNNNEPPKNTNLVALVKSVKRKTQLHKQKERR